MTTDMTYDPEANAVYIYLGRGQVASTEEVTPGVILDYDNERRVVGIEVLNARETLAPGSWSTAPSPEKRHATAVE